MGCGVEAVQLARGGDLWTHFLRVGLTRPIDFLVWGFKVLGYPNLGPEVRAFKQFKCSSQGGFIQGRHPCVN